MADYEAGDEETGDDEAGDHKDRPYGTAEHSQRDRRSVRLRGYDYSQAGAYFVTICTQNQEFLFGDILNDKMRLNEAGEMIRTVWNALPDRFPNVDLDEFVILPNHIHGIVVLTCRGEPCVRPGDSPKHSSFGDYPTEDRKLNDQKTGGYQTGEHKVRPYGTLPGTIGRILQAFKSITTHEYTLGVKQNGWLPFPGKLWQRNYWEHIIRNEPELNSIPNTSATIPYSGIWIN